MEVEPASIGLPTVRALSGSPPGEIAVEKVDLPGEETVAARLNRIPKVHIGLFLDRAGRGPTRADPRHWDPRYSRNSASNPLDPTRLI